MEKFATIAQIKQARAESQLSMKKAGPIIGYSPRAWESWESGARRMRNVVLEQFITKTKGEKNG